MEVLRINGTVGENAMRKGIKKVLALILMTAIVLTAVNLTPQSAAEVQAAVTPEFVSPNPVYTYKSGDGVKRYYADLRIAGCTKSSEIHALKSSNKNIKVKALNGMIRVEYGRKACKAKITCRVNGKKLATNFTVKKYTNPLSSLKIGGKEFKSKFNQKTMYGQKGSYKKKQLRIQLKKNWKITAVSVHTSSGKSWIFTEKGKGSASFSRQISLAGRGAGVYIYCTDTKTGISEQLIFYLKD